ncbi:MAG: iron chelate uptake ABC transporter family permease subunit [Planctomycetota bacterium]
MDETTLAAGTGSWPAMDEIVRTMTFRAGFNTNLVIAGTSLLGLAAGLVGVFALLRKRSMVTDALGHATLPGVAAAFLLAGWFGWEERALPVLLLGAAVSGVLGVVCIQLILRHSRLTEDVAIGVVLSVFFAAGIVGMSYIQANRPSGSAGLKGFIFGQAATMRPGDVALMAVLAAASVVATAAFFKEFVLVSFNASFARVDGWPVGAIDLAILTLVVLVTVAGLQAVGMILVVALLIVPPVAAGFWSERAWVVACVSAGGAAVSGYAGSVISALAPDVPAGSVIVLASGVFFVMSLVVAPSRGIVASLLRRLRLSLRIGGDHLLEHANDLSRLEITADDIVALARRRGWSGLFRHAAVWSLVRRGMLLPAGRGGWRTTDRGRQRGARVARNHALWEQYLVSYADIAPGQVDWSVDQVEHVLSERLVRELEEALAARGVDVPRLLGAASEHRAGVTA